MQLRARACGTNLEPDGEATKDYDYILDNREFTVADKLSGRLRGADALRLVSAYISASTATIYYTGHARRCR